MNTEQWTVNSGRQRDTVSEATTGHIVRSFRDLTVWQRSMDLAELIYRLTRDFPREETCGITEEIRRCAVFIPSIIAEGQGRSNMREFKRFLVAARGSNCKLQTQLELARRLNFGNCHLIDEAEDLSHEIGKMIFAFLSKLRT